jgi:ribonuclease E
LATKKTTTSRTKTKTAKKTKKTTASADSGLETQLTETGGTATAPPAATKPKTRRKATKKVTTRRRKAAPVETVAEETPAEQQDVAVAELEEAPPASELVTVPESAEPEPEQPAEPTPAHPRTRAFPETAEPSARQMERQDEVLVIRFPPVAPPPFEPRPVPAAETETAAPAPAASVAAREEPSESAVTEELEPQPEPALPEAVKETGLEEDVEAEMIEEEAIGAEPIEPVAERDEGRGPAAVERPREPDAAEPPGERRGRRRRRRRRSNGHENNGRAIQPAPSEAPARVEPQIRPRTPGGSQAAPQEFTAPPGRHLSPSQKRRLRRRRRSQENREAEPKAIATPAPPAPPEVEEAPAEESAPPVFDENEGVALARIPGLGDEELPELPSLEDVEEPDEERAAAPAQTRAAGRDRRGRQRPGRRPVEELEVEEHEGAEAPVVGTKEMIINVVPGEECRIAILHKGKLEEMYIERASAESHVGNIYKGLVTNVEPSIQAAFVDFGLGKNGFLHVSDLHPQYFPDGGQPAENVGRKLPRRSRPPIQRCLRRGQQIIVQITKEGIGTKGPTLSTYLSIPGRFLVMMPGMRQLGVSRKIEDDEVRIKLRSQLHELELPEGMGFIARTAAQDRTKRELQSDLKYLMRLWSMITRRMKEERAPAELYRESDLVIRTIRDLYSAEIGKIVVDDAAVAQRAREFLQIFSPRAGDVVHEYTDPVPIFHRYGIEAELDRLHSRHVPLRSGGSLVIEPTEALVAIDVNSGKFRTEDDAEATAFKINMEAADEIARQLRLRDLGGVIICDFIDMRQESHKRAIERRLASNLRQHKERAKILRMSQFGIIEMTRQRQRASLTRSVYQDCRYCHGTGLVKTGESVALDVMRIIQLNIIRDPVRVIELTVSPEVANHLLNRKRAALANLEAKYRRTILIRPEPNFGLDNVEVRCSDHRGRLIPPA